MSINSNEELFYIKFYPVIKAEVGCERATLILGRLEYWFEKYANGFYKFVEPCTHPLYREGDSWSEEIGFSRKIFVKAFDLIGVRYKSKSSFIKVHDKFQGKLYASYHDRKTNQTYFFRNHAFASQFIKGLFNRKSSSASVRPKKNTAKNSSCIMEVSSTLNGRSRNNQNGRSSGGTIGGKENNPIQRNTSSLSEVPPTSSFVHSEPLQKKVTEEMIKIWEEEVGELGFSSISAGFLKRLFNSFKNFFEQSLETWKSYCRMIASSKFLMGEAQNKFFKKAWITWAIKEETIERIRGGGFNLGDRETKLDEKVDKVKNDLITLEKEKNNIEEKIKYIKKSIEEKREETTKKRIKAFSEEELTYFRGEFENFLKIENNSISREFIKSGWKGMFVETYFEGFLEEKIYNQLFALSSDEEANKILEKSDFPEKLRDICSEIDHLKERRQELILEKTSDMVKVHFHQNI
ncbi:MAG: hypothetical protein KBD36_00300 [Alphaproteobacteria bacterium]|nr:hypothetical protein [Alphaproteobacteria bacterium]MBP9776277.1 hypothetical protein [Alphaproteobacteria bacterium]